jgi:hypothetical protein
MAGPLDTGWGNLFEDFVREDEKRQEEQVRQQQEEGGSTLPLTKDRLEAAARALCEYDIKRSGIAVDNPGFLDVRFERSGKHYMKLVDIVVSALTGGSDERPNNEQEWAEGDAAQ